MCGIFSTAPGIAAPLHCTELQNVCFASYVHHTSVALWKPSITVCRIFAASDYTLVTPRFNSVAVWCISLPFFFTAIAVCYKSMIFCYTSIALCCTLHTRLSPRPVPSQNVFQWAVWETCVSLLCHCNGFCRQAPGAHRNETAVRLGSGPRLKNSAAVRLAGDRRRRFRPKIRPTPPGGGPAG